MSNTRNRSASNGLASACLAAFASRHASHAASALRGRPLASSMASGRPAAARANAYRAWFGFRRTKRSSGDVLDARGCPVAERPLRQIAVVIPALGRHLGADPWRQIERLALVI